MNRVIGILAGLFTAVTLAMSASAAFAQEVTLKMHHFLPPQANVPKLVLDVWADKVEAASDGRIKIERYPSMQLASGDDPNNMISWSASGVSIPPGSPVSRLAPTFPSSTPVSTRLRTVSSRNSSREVVEAIQSRQQTYNAVITDMTMPEMTGDVLAAEIKKISPTLPVILCTGYSEKISNARAKLIGIDAFLMKPVGNAKLARTLRQVLDK